MAVIEGDLQTDNDARRVASTGAKAVQINTDGGCHLDSNLVMEALGAFDLNEIDILFIENVGNLVCPVEFDCGEDAKIALKATTSLKNTLSFSTVPVRWSSTRSISCPMWISM